jgi:hypothetical protein
VRELLKCGKCSEELKPQDTLCPKCGSGDRNVFVTDECKAHDGVKLKVKDKEGKTSRISVFRNKVSNHGKEAKEEYTVDITQNKYIQHVEEQDEKGNWKTVHTEDEPLTEHNKKKQNKDKS